jgi:hypothetical protein
MYEHMLMDLDTLSGLGIGKSMYGQYPCTGGEIYGRRSILYLGLVRLEYTVYANKKRPLVKIV